MNGHIIAGVDIGTHTTKTLIAVKKPADPQRPEETDIQILGFGQEPSSGVRRGVVINPQEVGEIIKRSFEKAQENAGQKISSAYINIGGSHIASTSSKGLISVSRADGKISESDIDRVLQAAQTFSLPSNKEILQVFPKEFIVDGEKGIKEVVGMQGVRLEVEAIVIYGFSPYIKNLSQAVISSGLQANDLIPSALASARAVLDERQKELGVILLDIGAGTTELAVFEEGSLIHLAVFPVGSANITHDIAVGLRTDVDTAERIKLEYGTCVYSPQKKVIKIEMAGGEGYLTFSPKILMQIIEPRVSEIFDLASKELKKISKSGILPAGVVLTGGGAKLPKICDIAKKELKLPVKIGIPRGFFPPQEDPALSAVCGMILTAADSTEVERFGKGILRKIKKIFRAFIP